jgi:hypothetical protein
LRNSKRLARRASGPYDKIVLVDGDQSFPHFVGDRDNQDARARMGQTETFGLDPRCGVNDRRQDEIDEALD